MNDKVLQNTIFWWERKRIAFNVLVGLVGVATVATFIPHIFGLEDLIGIIFWGIVANIFYATGIILEVANQYYLNGKLNIYRFRHFFFIIGTFAYMILTWSYTIFYYQSILFIP